MSVGRKDSATVASTFTRMLVAKGKRNSKCQEEAQLREELSLGTGSVETRKKKEVKIQKQLGYLMGQGCR